MTETISERQEGAERPGHSPADRCLRGLRALHHHRHHRAEVLGYRLALRAVALPGPPLLWRGATRTVLWPWLLVMAARASAWRCRWIQHLCAGPCHRGLQLSCCWAAWATALSTAGDRPDAAHIGRDSAGSGPLDRLSPPSPACGSRIFLLQRAKRSGDLLLPVSLLAGLTGPVDTQAPPSPLLAVRGLACCCSALRKSRMAWPAPMWATRVSLLTWRTNDNPRTRGVDQPGGSQQKTSHQNPVREPPRCIVGEKERAGPDRPQRGAERTCSSCWRPGGRPREGTTAGRPRLQVVMVSQSGS